MFSDNRMFAICINTVLVAGMFVWYGQLQAFGTPVTPKIIQVGLVAPNILSVTIRDGAIQSGHQTKYVAKPGDVIWLDNFVHWLKRDGVIIGSLAGKNRDVMMSFDRVTKGTIDPKTIQEPSHFRLTSTNDPAYKAGISPDSVHRKSLPYDMGSTSPTDFQGVCKHTLYLILKYPLKEGASYKLEFPELGLSPYKFSINANHLVSEAIHVSQIGFRPDDLVKIAYVSCWMGDGGGVLYKPNMPFRIVDADNGDTIYKGALALSKAASDLTEDAYNRNYNGVNVYLADFSAVKKPGRYALVLPGIGCSIPFIIDSKAWNGPFRTSVRGLLHQRNGIALGPPHTSFLKPRDFHPDDGQKVYASKAALIDTGDGPLAYDVEPTNFGNLVKGKTNELVSNAWGGYHDAGDWDRRIQHLIATRNLLDLVELFPGYSSKVNLNIPESGGKLPDMLSEALWGLDVFKRMQTKDGGIRGGIESEEHPPFGETSWTQTLTTMAYAPDAWSTYWYAGTAARAALVITKYNHVLAQEYKNSALKAMEWAEEQQKKEVKPMSAGINLFLRIGYWFIVAVLSLVLFLRRRSDSRVVRRRLVKGVCVGMMIFGMWRGVTVFADPGYPLDLHRFHLMRDARNYAAAELLRLTGDSRWKQVFKETTVFERPDAKDLLQWGSHDQSEAAWVYARIKGNGVDEKLRDLCLKAIRKTADERLGTCDSTGFHWTKYPWRPFGIGIPAAPDVSPLIWAHYLTNDARYLRGVMQAAQFGAGANPMNICLTTGVGQKYPLHPLDVDPRTSGQPTPPGLTVLGPMDSVGGYSSMDWGRKMIDPICYPALANWPPIETYMDIYWNSLMCEYTVQESIAPNFYCWGYLAGRS